MEEEAGKRKAQEERRQKELEAQRRREVRTASLLALARAQVALVLILWIVSEGLAAPELSSEPCLNGVRCCPAGAAGAGRAQVLARAGERPGRAGARAGPVRRGGGGGEGAAGPDPEEGAAVVRGGRQAAAVAGACGRCLVRNRPPGPARNPAVARVVETRARLSVARRRNTARRVAGAELFCSLLLLLHLLQ